MILKKKYIILSVIYINWNKILTASQNGTLIFTQQTHTRLTTLCPRPPGWAGTRKVKPIWILLTRDSEWQWHQLGHMQTICTSLQTDNHTSTPPLSFFTGRMPFLAPNQQRQSTEGKSVEDTYYSNRTITHQACQVPQKRHLDDESGFLGARSQGTEQHCQSAEGKYATEAEQKKVSRRRWSWRWTEQWVIAVGRWLLRRRAPSTTRCHAAVELYTRSYTQPTLWIWSTQPCIPTGSLNRVSASAGVRAGMSPLPGGR